MRMQYFLLVLLLLIVPWPTNAAAWTVPQHNPEVTVRQCLKCHPLALPTHRRNLVDKSKLPPGWPVAKNGRMVCLTCHSCENGTCKLRRNGRQLCMTCHDCKKGMACMLGKAHMGNANDLSVAVRDCRSCHDGTQAPLIGGFPDEHPLDIPYKGNGLNPMPDRHIIIVNGKVTCLSCHDPYSSYKYRLSYSNWQNVDNLCMQCHLAYKH